MNLTDQIVLIDPEGKRHPGHGKALQASAYEAEQDSLQIPTGSIRIVVPRWSAIQVDSWRIEFAWQTYTIIGITPYMKQRIPPRIVLLCQPGASSV